MNPLKAAYCRVYQFVFWLAIPLLPYRNPELLDSVMQIPEELKKRGYKAPFLVTDAMIRKLGLTSELEEKLRELGMEATVYDKVTPNPTTKMIEEALVIYKENHCDSIVAFGGGSPMDCAKAVGARVACPKKSLKKMAGILKVWKKIPFLVAVPTTAGTGSEATVASVVVDAETRHKYAISSFPLIPPMAVLDPKMIHTLPLSVAGTTGVDALTHAVEAYIGKSSTKETRAYSEEAVELIFKNLAAASRHESEEAEKNMLYAAHLAGRSFTRSYVGYVHAVSHSLSGKYNFPHGLTNAVILPHVLEMYGAAVYKKLAKLAKCVGVGNDSDSDEVRAKAFIAAVRDLNKELEIPEFLQGIKEEDLEELASYADKEANPGYPDPVLWDKEALKTVYRVVGQI